MGLYDTLNSILGILGDDGEDDAAGPQGPPSPPNLQPTPEITPLPNDTSAVSPPQGIMAGLGQSSPFDHPLMFGGYDDGADGTSVTVQGVGDPAVLPAAPQTGTATGAYGDGRDVIYQFPDGTTERRSDGTLAWRANNPGNLAYGPFAIRNGALGQANQGRAIFPDVDTGRAAMEQLLDNDPKYQRGTLNDLVATYAGHNNQDLPSYQAYVQNRLGLPGDAARQDMTGERWNDFKGALRRFENLTPGTVTRGWNGN